MESLSLDLTCFERFGIYLLCMLRMRFVSLKSRQTSRRNGEGDGVTEGADWDCRWSASTAVPLWDYLFVLFSPFPTSCRSLLNSRRRFGNCKTMQTVHSESEYECECEWESECECENSRIILIGGVNASSTTKSGSQLIKMEPFADLLLPFIATNCNKLLPCLDGLSTYTSLPSSLSYFPLPNYY